MSMTATEIRTAALTALRQAEEIDERYPQGLTPDVNATDFNEQRRLLAMVDEYEARLPQLEESERTRNRIKESIQKYQRPIVAPPDQEAREYRQGKTISPGNQFLGSEEYKSHLQGGAFNSQLNRIEFAVAMRAGTSFVERFQNRGRMRASDGYDSMEQKALMYAGSASVGGALVANDIRPGILDILQRDLTFLDVVPRLQTQSDTVEYIRQDTYTNNAAFVAEASASTGTSGTKPESALAYSTQTVPVQAMAHYIPITNRLLADAPAIRGIIDGQLLTGLARKLEDQILAGDGAGVNFRGILNTVGVLTQGLGGGSAIDAIWNARTQVRVTGHARPNVIVMHPNDFGAIRLVREDIAGSGTGGYLMGPPNQTGFVTLWGMPVVESEAITENTALVGDMVNGLALFDREQAAVRVGLVNDQFIRNMQTILAELRAALAVFRPSAFCLVTGI